MTGLELTFAWDAETPAAACYFRALVAKGVPIEPATSLTSSYVLGCRMSADRNRPPREPWEGE